MTTPQEPPAGFATSEEQLREHFRTFPFFQLLGMEMVEVEPHRAILSLSWRPDLTQPAGIMHGGVIAALVDTAIAQSLMLAPAFIAARSGGQVPVSVDLRIKYLRPVSAGKIFCEARAGRVGRMITHATAVVTDESGKEVATGDSIYMLVAPQQLQKRQ